ncbi:Icc protein [Methylohalomonas lacus]|uniref:Icc protein n=1 Tax=Methylohalomonas lacus TaxID=398773 RepID=A0AAE3HK98_9GAMM|nr:phosphodiesterase [Methylohalomonas lacus]MCS3902748.1 Icc protein [Methylohalomonas lacus]
MSLSLIQITDTHIQAEPGATFDGIDCAASLAAVLDHINAHEQPDRILLTGDLVHDPDSTSYRRLNDLLQAVERPVHAIPGNHDDPALMREQLDAPVRHERLIEQGGWRVLLLNSWLEGEHAGQLPAAELDWLAEQLEQQPDTPSLVALHHPPVSIGSPWMDAMGLRNADDLLTVIDRQPQVAGVIWGHIHQQFESERHGVRLLGCPSTCVQFRPGSDEYARDELGPGYRHLLLTDSGEIRTTVTRVNS